MFNPAPSEPGRIKAAFAVGRGDFRLRAELDVPARGLTAIFGPSGSGKTMFLRVLAGLERAHGMVRVDTETWQDDAGLFVPTHRRAVGFVFQDSSLFPHLTVRGNLEYARKRARSSRGDGVDGIVDLLGIGPLLERRPANLSGGERQRIAIARALLARPRLLLMDEPLASLDAARRAEVLPYLERLRDTSSIPILYVSHSLEEVSRLANHLVLLERGSILASGPTAETLGRLDLPTAHLDDAAVVIETQIAAHDEADHLTRLTFGGLSLWIGLVDKPRGASLRVRVLARDVSLARDPPGPSSILNVLPARVDALRDEGPDRVNVRLTVGIGAAPLLARITRRSCSALGLEPGVVVHALVKAVALVA